ncbi:MAG TPA: glycosyltransferase family 39 protein [Candidatus Hydrogenedentes bacterium]|nr:glycosyltransferase family 39 protein [Candidatus Hydrogenedentota bacterium]
MAEPVTAPPVPPSPESSGPRRVAPWEWRSLGLILLLGLLLRVAYLSQVAQAPDFAALQQDPQVQDYFARAILSGDWSVPEGATDPEMRTTPFFRPPGYGYLLTAVYWLTDGSYLAPRLLNLFLGLGTIVVLFLLGRALFSPAAGLFSAFCAAVLGIFVYWEGEVNDPALFVFLFPLLVYVLFLWSRNCSPGWAVLAGLIFGSYALMRPNILGLGPLAAAWMVWVAWRRGRLARIPASWLLLLVTTVLVVIPVTVRNYVASGEFVPIATYFGENLLIGNDPDADGVTPWLPYLQELEGTGNWTAQDYINVVKGVRKELGRPEMTHTEVSSYFADRAKAFMRATPA